MTSNKKFGFFFSIIFFLISLFFIFSTSNKVAIFIFLNLAIYFLIMSLLFPEKLKILNILWLQIGILLSKIFSKVFIFFIYFIIIGTTKLLALAAKKKFLENKFDKELNTYWDCTDKYKVNNNSFNFQF